MPHYAFDEGNVAAEAVKCFGMLTVQRNFQFDSGSHAIFSHQKIEIPLRLRGRAAPWRDLKGTLKLNASAHAPKPVSEVKLQGTLVVYGAAF